MENTTSKPEDQATGAADSLTKDLLEQHLCMCALPLPILGKAMAYAFELYEGLYGGPLIVRMGDPPDPADTWIDYADEPNLWKHARIDGAINMEDFARALLFSLRVQVARAAAQPPRRL